MTSAILKDYFLSNDGAKIFYRYDRGNSGFPVVVLLHGWVMNFTAMEKSREFFNRNGISTLNIDIRGHGYSASDSFSFDIIVEDIRGILKKEKIEEVVLFGYCMGGMIACEFVEHYSDLVKGIIFINTSYINPALRLPYSNPRLIKRLFSNIHLILKDEEKRHYFAHAWLNLFADHLLLVRSIYKSFNAITKGEFKCNTENKVVDFAECADKPDVFVNCEGLVATDYRIAKKAYLLMLSMNLKDHILKIKTPTLIISSKNDAICNLKTAQKIKNMIPCSEICILNNSDHLSILQENEEINNLALDFFNRKIKKEAGSNA